MTKKELYKIFLKNNRQVPYKMIFDLYGENNENDEILKNFIEIMLKPTEPKPFIIYTTLESSKYIDKIISDLYNKNT